jgi:hypothetical protein
MEMLLRSFVSLISVSPPNVSVLLARIFFPFDESLGDISVSFLYFKSLFWRVSCAFRSPFAPSSFLLSIMLLLHFFLSPRALFSLEFS